MSWLSYLISRITRKKPVVVPAPVVIAPPAPPLPVPVPEPSPVPVTAPARTVIGIGTHGSDNDAAIIASMGVKHVRVTFEPDREHAHHPEFAARLLDLRNHGLEVLVMVPTQPDAWSRRVPDEMAGLARAFPGTTWQVGNEWDAKGYKGQQYAWIMQETLPAMKAADPTCKVVGMGLSCTDGQIWAFMPDTIRQSAFLNDYLHEGGPILDAWAIHAYGYPLADALTARVKATQAVLQGRSPLWITEMGMDRAWIERNSAREKDESLSLAFVDRMQSAQIVAGIKAASALGVEQTFIYQLVSAESGAPESDGFGLLRADAKTERPVCEAMRALTR